MQSYGVAPQPFNFFPCFSVVQFSTRTFFSRIRRRAAHHYIKKKRARAQIASIFYKPTQDYDSSYISGYWH
jgi:hypothetical protein